MISQFDSSGLITSGPLRKIVLNNIREVLVHKGAVSLTRADPGTVAIVTSDGRMIVGTLKGFDQTINLILDESHERVFSSSQGVEQVVLGLYIVRGDNVAVIGEIDEETDSTLDLGNIRAEPLNSVVH
ncbi:LSM8 homolog, U6 small nuclear RNA associated isoform X1 [Neolamprologus brichardi]|uniref:LSM8 homolog, U6 small nuclear RNA associated isoform X1 n=1 Tax=Neolamprologus brichardi TaxID=32507 RepID=UPI001643F72E|nr:LSM8 homolog, U6 small nuclear RNA associated isoform X1 [Neolamprologus brichardi]